MADRSTRTLGFALSVWLLASAVAVAAAGSGGRIGVFAGLAGGAVFGVIAARRVDGRRRRQASGDAV